MGRPAFCSINSGRCFLPGRHQDIPHVGKCGLIAFRQGTQRCQPVLHLEIHIHMHILRTIDIVIDIIIPDSSHVRGKGRILPGGGDKQVAPVLEQSRILLSLCLFPEPFIGGQFPHILSSQGNIHPVIQSAYILYVLLSELFIALLPCFLQTPSGRFLRIRLKHIRFQIH